VDLWTIARGTRGAAKRDAPSNVFASCRGRDVRARQQTERRRARSSGEVVTRVPRTPHSGNDRLQRRKLVHADKRDQGKARRAVEVHLARGLRPLQV
jgi:hypothetical protein